MTSFQKALLSARTARHGRIVRTPHGVPAGLALIGANLAGLTLTAGVIAQEAGHAPVLGAATVPDQSPVEEQPQHDAANATTGSVRTYRYEPRTTVPAHPSAPPLFHGDGRTGEVWS
ncbi:MULTISPECIES: hypothetical protein [Streptomyces]|uniref:hypothetical protein n=1 Tax=Streptomyces TaxID=1883 RepID=UPI0033A97640